MQKVKPLCKVLKNTVLRRASVFAATKTARKRKKGGAFTPPTTEKNDPYFIRSFVGISSASAMRATVDSLGSPLIMALRVPAVTPIL